MVPVGIQPFSESELQAIEKNLASTTAGPWKLRPGEDDPDEEHVDHQHIEGPNGEPIAIVECGEDQGADAVFLASARALVPRMAAELRRLKGLLHQPHHTHACQRCGLPWRPAVQATVGVQFLPGFKDVVGP